MTVLGLLPAIRGGLGALAETGQHSRLIDGYVRPYLRAFGEVRYFSYLRESLERYTDDAELLRKVRVFPAWPVHPWLYTALLPLHHAVALRRCAVLRVFQITGVVPALIAKRRFGVPFVTTYGFWYSALARSGTTRWLRRRVEAMGLAAADAVIVPTAELRAHVAARVDPSRVHQIPNGVDTARFIPGRRERRSRKRVLYVGRVAPEKNLEVLVQAMGKLVGHLDLELMLVGDGPAREALVDAARRWAVRLKVKPFVDHHLLPEIFAAADVFVLPSLTEGHPKVLLEAMSSGLACIASNVGGNRAILADGESGLLVDPTDSGALAERLERVLTEESYARALGERARAEVVARYDLGALVAEEIALLRRLAGAA